MPPDMSEGMIAGIGYVCGLVIAALLNSTELMKHPAKAKRYGALPWYYKAICPVGVVPLFTAVPLFFLLRGELAVAALTGALAPVGMLAAELLTVRWYRRAGML